MEKKYKRVLVTFCLLFGLLAACSQPEPKGHIHEWRPANFQKPETCRCGETQGEPVSPYFLGLDDITPIVVGNEYPYVTISNDKPDHKVNGRFRINDFRIVDSEAELEARVAYKWYIVEFEFLFDEAEGAKYGAKYDFSGVDYYVGTWYNAEFSVRWSGENTFDCIAVEQYSAAWEGKTYSSKWLYALQLPIHYDGAVLIVYSPGLFNQLNEKFTKEDKYVRPWDLVDENFLYFRMIEQK